VIYVAPNYKKIEYNSVQAKRQDFEWGTINWIYEPNEKSNMVIGHVTFYPFKVQGKHMHTGDEQVIYTISGQGEHWINNKYYPLLPGNFYHIPPYAEHDIRNTGDTPLEMNIVYNMNTSFLDNLTPKVEITNDYMNASLINLVEKDILQNIIEDLSKVIELNIVIQDEFGNNLTELKNIPEFCRIYSKKCDSCYLFNSGEEITKIKESYFISECCCDLVKIIAPIYINDRLIGNIICGPVILTNYSDDIINMLKEDEKKGFDNLLEEYFKIRRVTKGKLYALMESLKRINNYIVDMALKNMINEELRKKSVEILEQKKDKIELEKNLVEAQMKVIQSQISPHFLFNTLSVIAQLAYMNGAKEAADTTFALSNLLRTSLSKAQEFVTVKEEIKYIEDYVFIQNKRFNDVIKMDILIESGSENKYIPFMIIQILVENSIVHGFEKLSSSGEIKVTAKLEDEKLNLTVEDNGSGISDEAIEKFYENFKEKENLKGKGIGLKSIYKRLKYYYKENFKIDIERIESRGTRVNLILPQANDRGDVID